MTGASTLGIMSPKLLLVAERAKRDPNGRILALAHLIDIAALRRAYQRQRNDAAVGVDGMTKKEYGLNLAERLQDLLVAGLRLPIASSFAVAHSFGIKCRSAALTPHAGSPPVIEIGPMSSSRLGISLARSIHCRWLVVPRTRPRKMESSSF
jgi:hypothetical protein